MGNPLADLPKMDRVLASAALVGSPWRRDIVRRVASTMLDELRAAVRGGSAGTSPDADAFAASVAARLEAWSVPRPRSVINATGVVLHTNLGRAPWSQAAIDAAIIAAGACDLELDLDDGVRDSRLAMLRPLLTAVIGAPDVHVVNNNAAALLLACTVLGQPGGIALSHGQMVEIGDGFRVAAMAAAGGCRVIAVGSTNRTHLVDYAGAIDPRGETRASAILWVHLSNFEQRGYVADVELAALAALARSHAVPLVADAGSGSLGGIASDREPTLAQYLEQGADVVLASGDKLLGGPQAGIISGGAAWIERIRRHPMARALRPDKTTIAALHATALGHARGESLPVHAMATESIDALRVRACDIAARVGLPAAAVVDAEATLGGGSLPGETLPSIALRITGDASALARRLRLGAPPVVARIDAGAVWIDLRTVPPGADEDLVAALAAVRRW